MNPFNLYSLPSVALSEVFKHFIFLELYLLSLVSKRMATLINRCGNRKLILDLSFSPSNSSIQIKSGQDSDGECICIIARTESLINPSIKEELSMTYHSPDTLTIVRIHHIPYLYSIFPHLTNTFACSFGNFGLLKLTKEITKEAIEWINSQNAFLENALIDTQKTDLDMLPCFVDNLKIRNGMFIFSPVSPQFEYTLNTTMKEMTIECAEWMTFDNLMMLNVEKLELCEASFTNENMDCLIKKWKSGGLSKLKLLKFSSKNLNNESPIDRIVPPIMHEEQRNQPKISVKVAMFPVSVDIGMEIVRNDGVKANLYVNTTLDPPEFCFYVFD